MERVNRLRVREYGIIIGEYCTGPKNSISDVKGVKVGHYTLIRGEGKLVPGHGPVRTGVTVIFPNDNIYRNKVIAAYHVINGFGKPIGLLQVGELGLLESPIGLTNTLNIGIVADALIEYTIRSNSDIDVYTFNPVVLECNDSYLNDIQGRHVRHNHVFKAIENLSNDIVEGSVGAGTGMVSFGFKGGIGTSSRKLSGKLGGYTVGVLVLTNFGYMKDLRINGVPVGLELRKFFRKDIEKNDGSIIIIVATDAPLNSRQLRRLAKRACNGISRVGGISSHGSGEFVLAFSTRNTVSYNDIVLLDETILNDAYLSPLFRAVIEATEEAVLNSLFKSETMKGRDNHIVYGIPIDKVLEILDSHGLVR